MSRHFTPISIGNRVCKQHSYLLIVVRESLDRLCFVQEQKQTSKNKTTQIWMGGPF